MCTRNNATSRDAVRRDRCPRYYTWYNALRYLYIRVTYYICACKACVRVRVVLLTPVGRMCETNFCDYRMLRRRTERVNSGSRAERDDDAVFALTGPCVRIIICESVYCSARAQRDRPKVRLRIYISQEVCFAQTAKRKRHYKSYNICIYVYTVDSRYVESQGEREKVEISSFIRIF
jgi:hypothetical protein